MSVKSAWVFIKRHVWGDEETMPDHARLYWILTLITINQDLSVPVLYTAIMQTSYGCDVFTLYGIYYGLSQVNFVMPLACGWLVDALGRWSHIVLVVTCIMLSLLQAATFFVTSVWLLGAIFLARQWMINQAVVQSYKLMAIRTHKIFNDDEDKKEQECQRTGATADFWTSFGEGIVYVVVYVIPDGWFGRLVLVGIAVGCTVVVAGLSMSYKQRDLVSEEEEDLVDDTDADTVITTSTSVTDRSAAGHSLLDKEQDDCCDFSSYTSLEEGSKLRAILAYLWAARKFFIQFDIAVPLWHYILLQLFRSVVTLPLSQNVADGIPAETPGVCDGVLKNIYLQGAFTNVFYLIGSVLYLMFVALLKPWAYFLYVYPLLAVISGGLATVFYFDGINAYWASIVLSLMNTASYYGTEFDTWYLMSVIDDWLYGFYTAVSGVLLSLTALLASAYMTLGISNQLVLLTAQGLAGLTVVMSVIFAIVARKRLRAMDFTPLEG